KALTIHHELGSNCRQHKTSRAGFDHPGRSRIANCLLAGLLQTKMEVSGGSSGSASAGIAPDRAGLLSAGNDRAPLFPWTRLRVALRKHFAIHLSRTGCGFG